MPTPKALVKPFFALLILALLVGSFVLGLRSAIQKDRAYFWTKELKVLAYHEYNLVADKFRGKSNRDPEGTIKVFTANDFTLELVTDAKFPFTEKTAGYLKDAATNLVKYEQNDLDNFWKKEKISEIVPNAEPTRFRGGGLKQIINHHGQTLALLSLQSEKCFFSSLVNVTSRVQVLKTPCLPEVEEIDFNSIGGGAISMEDGLFFAIGTPSDNEKIAGLAQNPDSPYGKVLFFPEENITKPNPDAEVRYKVFASGIRNVQGMTKIGDSIFFVEHGPKGGDEINFLEANANFGWPLYSMGSSYQGKPHAPFGDPKKFTEPLYSFIPSIAPSDIKSCPPALSQRYAPLTCVMLSTLRAMSIFVGLLDNDNRVVSLEQIPVDMRIREFVQLADGQLAISTDGFGLFKINILDLASR